MLTIQSGSLSLRRTISCTDFHNTYNLQRLQTVDLHTGCVSQTNMGTEGCPLSLPTSIRVRIIIL